MDVILSSPGIHASRRFIPSEVRCYYILLVYYSWWFQPIKNILYSQMRSFPKIGMKKKNETTTRYMCGRKLKGYC